MAFRVVAEADDRVFLQCVGDKIVDHRKPSPLPATPTVGDNVMAPRNNGNMYPGKVSAVTSHNGSHVVSILFDDGDSRNVVDWASCQGGPQPRNIHEAVDRNDLKAVQASIAAGQDLNVTGPDGNYPLACAASDGYTDIVDELIKGGSEVNKTAGNGAAALHYAAFKGREECVHRLLAAAADVTIEANNGMNPLEWAVAHKRRGVVQILEPLTPDRNAALKAKNAVADPKTIDLFQAVNIGDVVGIERAAAGADVNVRNGDEETPLHKAVLYDHLANQSSVVNALLKGGALKDAKRKGGWTPLHLAAEHGQDECAEILITAGADVKLKGSNGMTALDIAKACRSTEIVKMLEAPRGKSAGEGAKKKNMCPNILYR